MLSVRRVSRMGDVPGWATVTSEFVRQPDSIQLFLLGILQQTSKQCIRLTLLSAQEKTPLKTKTHREGDMLPHLFVYFVSSSAGNERWQEERKRKGKGEMRILQHPLNWYCYHGYVALGQLCWKQRQPLRNGGLRICHVTTLSRSLFFFLSPYLSLTFSPAVSLSLSLSLFLSISFFLSHTLPVLSHALFAILSSMYAIKFMFKIDANDFRIISVLCIIRIVCALL